MANCYDRAMALNRRTMLTRRTFLAGAAAVGAVGLVACADDSASPAATTDVPTPEPATTEPAATAAPTTAAPVTTMGSTTTAAAPAGGPARYVRSGPATSGAVALTFHAAGDAGRATRLLEVLARSRTPVTVFAVGNWLAANPRLAQRCVADGHELANHTWSHQGMGSLAPAALGPEITRCAEAIRATTGSIGRWFRPSGIEVPTPAILEAAGRAGYGVSVGYDVDSLDFQDPGVAAVKANTINGLRAGAIVSLHFDHDQTIEALPAIVDALRAKGLRAVTVSTLLG